jgi:hypothetical protein
MGVRLDSKAAVNFDIWGRGSDIFAPWPIPGDAPGENKQDANASHGRVHTQSNSNEGRDYF